MHYEQNAYPGVHSPPSYVALSRDARIACATTIHDIAIICTPWPYSRNTYTENIQLTLFNCCAIITK